MPDHESDPRLPSDEIGRRYDPASVAPVPVTDPRHKGLSPQDAATPCAGCQHRADAHNVATGSWPCLHPGCACQGFNQVTLTARPGATEAIAAGIQAAAAAIDSGGDPLEASRQAMEASFAATDDLPIRRRNPPPLPPPPRTIRREGVAIRLARAVLADPPPPGEALRLDRPVKRSIVSAKAREFAAAYGLRFKVYTDFVDLDADCARCGHPAADHPEAAADRPCGHADCPCGQFEPNSPKDLYLFCEVADTPDAEMLR